MSERPAQSFGEQAARFSLYAPLLAFFIGIIANASRDKASAAMPLLIINCLLVVAGLVLGIAALVSMRRYGRQGILGRAIAGVLLNGMIVTALAAVVLPLVLAGRVKNQLPGQWSLQAAPKQVMDSTTMTLNQDGTFILESSRDSATIMSVSGTWVLTRTRVLGVNIERVKQGEPSAVGQRIGLGTVKSIDEKQMTLQTDNGEERYARVR
jgi:hypothetical protein